MAEQESKNVIFSTETSRGIYYAKFFDGGGMIEMSAWEKNLNYGSGENEKGGRETEKIA